MGDAPPLGQPALATALRLTLEAYITGGKVGRRTGYQHPEAAIASWDTRHLDEGFKEEMKALSKDEAVLGKDRRDTHRSSETAPAPRCSAALWPPSLL